jgi:tetratricopeptide (TPR) repeat protein
VPAPTPLPRHDVVRALGDGGTLLLAHPVTGRRLVARPLRGVAAERRLRHLSRAGAAPGARDGYEPWIPAPALWDGVPHAVRAWVDGEPLAARLAGGPLPPAEAATLAAGLARALAALHAARVAHGALHPGNVILLPGGGVRLVDGLEQAAPPAGAPAPAEARRAAYAAPEVLRGAAPGRAGDVFALGVVLYEALAGEHPFAAADPLETARRVLHGERAPLALTGAGVEPALAAAVERMLSAGRWRRPSARRCVPPGRVETAGVGAETPSAIADAIVSATATATATQTEIEIATRNATQTETRTERARANLTLLPTATAGATDVSNPMATPRASRSTPPAGIPRRIQRRPVPPALLAVQPRERLLALAAALLLAVGGGGLAVRAAWRHHRDGALTARVEELLATGDLQGAGRVLREAQRSRPEDPAVERLLGDLAQARGDSRRALRHWRAALERDPDVADAALRERALALLGTADGRSDLAAVLAALGDEVEAPLLRATASGAYWERWNAVRALEARGQGKRIDYAQVYLQDLARGGSCATRRAAAVRLEHLRAPSALPGLERVRGSLGFLDRMCMADAVDRAIDATRAAGGDVRM